jgi:hypothetical protein
MIIYYSQGKITGDHWICGVAYAFGDYPPPACFFEKMGDLMDKVSQLSRF